MKKKALNCIMMIAWVGFTLCISDIYKHIGLLLAPSLLPVSDEKHTGVIALDPVYRVRYKDPRAEEKWPLALFHNHFLHSAILGWFYHRSHASTLCKKLHFVSPLSYNILLQWFLNSLSLKTHFKKCFTLPAT